MARLRIAALAVLASLFTGPARAGNLYVADLTAQAVDTITPGGSVSTLASGLSSPHGLAFDKAGNLYVAESSNGSVDTITPGGSISTFASLSTTSCLGLAFDKAGNLYASDSNGTIFLVTPGGSVSTFASVPVVVGGWRVFWPSTRPATCAHRVRLTTGDLRNHARRYLFDVRRRESPFRSGV